MVRKSKKQHKVVRMTAIRDKEQEKKKRKMEDKKERGTKRKCILKNLGADENGGCCFFSFLFLSGCGLQ